MTQTRLTVSDVGPSQGSLRDRARHDWLSLQLEEVLDSPAATDKAPARVVEAVLEESWRLARSKECSLLFTRMSQKLVPLEFTMIGERVYAGVLTRLLTVGVTGIHAKDPGQIVYAWSVMDTKSSGMDEDNIANGIASHSPITQRPRCAVTPTSGMKCANSASGTITHTGVSGGGWRSVSMAWSS